MDAVLVHCFDQRVSVDKIGVWVVSAEVWLWHAVLGAILEAEFFLEDVHAVAACHSGEAVEEDLEVLVLLEEFLDQVEVEDRFEHFHIVLRAVHDLNFQRTDFLRSNLREVDIWDIHDLIRRERLGGLVDLVRDALWSRSAVGEIVLDTEIFIRTTRVVAGCEEYSTCCFPDADDMARCWCRHDAILPDQELLHAICCTDLRNQLHDFWVPVATITTNDEEGAIGTFGDGEEDGGNEVFGVVLLLEDLDLLSKAGAVHTISLVRMIKNQR